MAAKLTRSYFNAGCSKPITHTVPELLDIRGTQFPEKEAYVIRDIGKPRQVITFGELKSKTEQLAIGMIKSGLKKGDCVGLLCSTSLEYIICEYALARVGAILIRCSSITGGDIKHVLKKSNCRWLIAHPGVEGKTYNILRGFIPELKDCDLSQAISPTDIPDLKTIFMISPALFQGTLPWTALFPDIQDGDLDQLNERQAMVSVDDVSTCYTTSGSTGVPKLVAHRHTYGVNRMRSVFVLNGVDETDRLALDRPMFYVGGNTGNAVGIGCTMVYVMCGAKEKKSREMFFKAIEEERITVMNCYPYILPDLIKTIDAGHIDISRIKLCWASGEIMQRSLIEGAMKRIPCLIQTYGSTEAGAPLGDMLTHSIEQKLTYTGVPLDGELKIVDHLGVVVPVNTAGEMCIRSQYMFLKYWGDEEKTKQQKDDLDWYETDDMAVMTEGGFITILGRRHTVISKATVKIYPLTIEKQLLQHPLVSNVLAVGIPHEILYEDICVCVIPKSNVCLTVEEIRTFCEERFLVGDIGEGLMPDYILLFESFPTGSTAIARLAEQNESFNF